MVMAEGGRLHLNLKPQGVMKDRATYSKHHFSPQTIGNVNESSEDHLHFKDFKKDIIHLYFRHSD